MTAEGREDLPPIFMPEQAATAEAPDGRRMAFFYVPQAEGLIKRLLADPPSAYTYRWAYHAGHRVHILFVWWHDREALGLAIPEGAGDQVLDFITGCADVCLTLVPVQQEFRERMGHQDIERIIGSLTVGLPALQFQRKTGNEAPPASPDGTHT